MITQEELTHRFTHHPPSEMQIEQYQMLREFGNNLSNSILNLCPESREQSIAFTKLEECIFWANAAIARRTGETE